MSTSVLDVSEEIGAVHTLPVGGILCDRDVLDEDIVVSNRRYWMVLDGYTVPLADDSVIISSR